MRSFWVARIEATLLALDRLDKKYPRVKNLTVFPALALVLFRERIDPCVTPVDATLVDPASEWVQIGPCRLMKNSDGSFGLLYDAREEASDYIEGMRGQGGGYSWEALVRAVMAMRGHEDLEVNFDPEADMFAAYSPHEASLHVLAHIIRELAEDRALLDQAINYAKAKGSFE